MGGRLEKDSLGEREIPSDAYYGIHALRSSENFNVSGEKLPLELIYAMASLKQACALANGRLDLLPPEKVQAIEEACKAVRSGRFDDQFVIDIFQAGSGTSSNMNLNEVVANFACEILGGSRGERSLVHPNDDVNKGQSTNNVFPSGIRVAAVELCGPLLEAMAELKAELLNKGNEFASILKSGRTHLQDAVPITLGQEFAAYARAVQKDIQRIENACDVLRELGVGGNAVGTGVNTPELFRTEVIDALDRLTGETYRVAENGIEATQFLTDLAQMSFALRSVALDVLKITNDLRLLGSGPNTGLGEIVLPAVEPGSSIMPGKVNPSICEAANMACLQVIGNDTVVSMACGAGQLELNTHMPLIGANLVKSFRLMERCCGMLSQKCVKGIEARPDMCRRHFEASAGLATILNPKLGYDRVAELVKRSIEEKKDLRQLLRETQLVSEEEFEELMRHATRPNL